MNLLKSMFISGYMMLIMGVTAYPGWMLYQGASPIAWIGAMLTAVPMLMVLSRLMMLKDTARTSAHFPIPNALGASGVAMSAWAWLSLDADILAPVLADISWACFMLYAYWFSTFGGRQPSIRLRLGNKLPHFTLRATNGALLTSAQLTDKPAILIFYRGNWCPLCMAQIKELVARYKDISALGVRVALIAPQPHDNTVELADKFGVKFDFLTDEGNAAARALGIENPNGIPMGMQALGYDSESVMPTVIITNGDGEIVWAHETDNYRIRPEPDVYLDVLRKHGIVAAA